MSPPSVRIELLVIRFFFFFWHQMSFKLKGRQGDTLVTVLVQSYWSSLHCGMVQGLNYKWWLFVALIVIFSCLGSWNFIWVLAAEFVREIPLILNLIFAFGTTSLSSSGDRGKRGTSPPYISRNLVMDFFLVTRPEAQIYLKPYYLLPLAH